MNNAGVLSRETMTSPGGLQTARRVMDVNFFGAMNMIGAWLDSLKSARGTIINIASIASFRALPNSVGYAPSKAALAMLTRDFARELAPDGVRVNAIAPGVIETPMTAATMADPARLSSFLSRIPMGRVGQPTELGGPVVFLASDLASYVTGTVLPVDGGYLT